MVRIFIPLLLALILAGCDTYPRPEIPKALQVTDGSVPKEGWRNSDFQHLLRLRVYITPNMYDSVEEIWEAMAWWNDKVGCKFLIYEHKSVWDAEILVTYHPVQRVPPLATAGYKILREGKRTKIISRITVYPKSYTAKFYPVFEYILRHELGHVIGLEHFPKVKSNIMYFQVSEKTAESKVTADTLAALRLRYCPRFYRRGKGSNGKNHGKSNTSGY